MIFIKRGFQQKKLNGGIKGDTGVKTGSKQA